MLDLRIFDQEMRGIHDFGEAGLVVGAEQRGAVRRDDVVADLVGERGMIGGADHLGRVGRQRNIAAAIVLHDLRPDVRLPVQSGEVSICEQKQITDTCLSVLAGIVA